MPIAARRKICFATAEYPPHAGGVARSAHRLVHGLIAEGYEVVVLTTITGEQGGRDLPAADGDARIAWAPRTMADAASAIAHHDAVEAFDLFHGFTLIAAYLCLPVAAAGQRPVVASIRGMDGMSFDEATSEVLRRADWITSVSRDSLTRALALTDISARSSVIPNGVDVQRFANWTPSSANEGIVGTVATFRRKKNIPLLIRAYARLPRALRRGLLLVGDAYEGNAVSVEGRQAINAAIDDEAIRGEVELTGLVEHARLPGYHERMRVFALSSDHEGMPNALLEAAASGVPIVATAVDGVKDILTDGKDALLVPAGDADALAAALGRVLSDEALARRLSAAARETAQRLSIEAELRGYVGVYEALLARRVVA
jgi:L-malate glycosyltransferase